MFNSLHVCIRSLLDITSCSVRDPVIFWLIRSVPVRLLFLLDSGWQTNIWNNWKRRIITFSKHIFSCLENVNVICWNQLCLSEINCALLGSIRINCAILQITCHVILNRLVLLCLDIVCIDFIDLVFWSLVLRFT